MIHLHQARGVALDNMGRMLSLPRRRWLWVFRESDAAYRARLLRRLRGIGA